MSHKLDLLRPLHALFYADGLRLQEGLFARILAARAAGQGFAGGVILLQHTPTITLGKEAMLAELLAPEATLAAQGIKVVRTDRGGKITVHAPGQWVLYPVLDLNVFGKDVTAHIRKLEEVAIRTAAQFGVTAVRIPGVSGAWVSPPSVSPSKPEAKLCAVGIAVRKWITRHGLCFNVVADRSVYRHIVPCGQAERGVTSLQDLMRDPPDLPRLLDDAATALLADFAAVFDAKWVPSAAPVTTHA